MKTDPGMNCIRMKGKRYVAREREIGECGEEEDKEGAAPRKRENEAKRF